MTPIKKASRETKRAARPRKQTTKLSALVTGLRLTTTINPKTSMIPAKVQKSAGAIALFLFVPLVDQPGHDPAKLVKLFLIMDHLRPAQPGNRIIFPQKDGLLWTDLFTQAAVDASDHVDL